MRRILLAISVLSMLAACVGSSAVAEDKETQKGRFKVDMASSYYWCYVPEKYNGDGTTGVILVMHGSGGTADGMLSCFMYKDGGGTYLDENNYICICPKSVRLEGWEEKDPLPMTALNDVMAKYKVDKKRIHIFGFSNGGFFTSWQYYERLDLFRTGVIAAAFLVYANMATVKKNPNKPMFFIFGEKDPNRQGAEQNYDQLISFGSKYVRKFMMEGEEHNIPFQKEFPRLFKWYTAMESGYDYAAALEKAAKAVKAKIESAMELVAEVEKHPEEDVFWEQLARIKKEINDAGEKRLKSLISMYKPKPEDLIKRLKEFEERFKGYPVADKAKEEREKAEAAVKPAG
ncbi:MAG: prolyl oligopeptidase family serine peptidase [Candidatus Brocadiia bacterium]